MNVTCNYFAVCKAFAAKDARCVCVENCPSYEEPVCSSNGTTYDNECLYKRDMCHLEANFTIYHPGSCTGKWSTQHFRTSLGRTGPCVCSVDQEVQTIYVFELRRMNSLLLLFLNKL